MLFRVKTKIRNIMNHNSFLKKNYELANLIKIEVTKNISDDLFSKLIFKSNTGKNLNLENPTTFNEKIWWLKLNNRDPLLTFCSDKYKVRDYIKRCGLENILNDFYGYYDKAEDINFHDLPEKAFIKTNHGSYGGQVWDNKNPFDRKKFIEKFNKLLRKNYYWQSREWNYKNIEPKIIAEKLLVTDDDRGLVDYKFLCFDGEVKLLWVELDILKSDGTKNHSPKRNFYDKKFNFMDIQMGGPNFDRSLSTKPDNFEKMVEYAEIISKPFPHCRVDFYNIEGDIIFGEMTFYHAGGLDEIKPCKYNQIMGDWIDIESDKIVTE